MRNLTKAEQKARGYTSSHAGASAAIKAELQAYFNGIKFSVTSESFSGGNAVRIHWEDGPTESQVEAISSKYQYGHFNGMEDIYENTNDRADIPQVNYVTTSRTQSKAIKALLSDFAAMFHPDQLNDYRNTPDQILYRVFVLTSLPSVYSNLRIERTDVKCGQWVEFYKIVFDVEQPQSKAQPVYEEVKTVQNEINIVDYSEKSFAVIGDTKPLKDKLKELGGSFNARLSCGAGWIFSKKKLDDVTKALSSKAAEPKEAVKEYTNLKDIEEAAHSGKVISLLNLSNLVNA